MDNNAKRYANRLFNEEKKLNIWLDVDSVLADFGAYFLEYLNINNKTPAYDWDDPRYRDNFHKIANDLNFWKNIPPLSYPSEIDFDVSGYCTARPIESYVTEIWLLDNDFPCKKVITVGHNGSKLESLQEVKCDVFLDDAPHNFEELNDNGMLTYLFDRPHNRSLNTKLRVYSLGEFSEIINNLKN